MTKPLIPAVGNVVSFNSYKQRQDQPKRHRHGPAATVSISEEGCVRFMVNLLAQAIIDDDRDFFRTSQAEKVVGSIPSSILERAVGEHVAGMSPKQLCTLIHGNMILGKYADLQRLPTQGE